MDAFPGDSVTDSTGVSDLRQSAVTLGLLTPEAFAAAATTIPALAAYADYDDWLDARDGQRMGLALGGVDAEFAPVSLTALLAWARLTRSKLDEAALDRLAGFVRAVRQTPKAVAFATIAARDLAAFADRLDGNGGARDFTAWLRRRRARRANLEADGAHVFEVPIHLCDIVAWCDCFEQPVCEAALDAYAALLLELLTTT
jgi:hypothetical protein